MEARAGRHARRRDRALGARRANDLNELSRACDVCVIRDEEKKEWAVWLWHYKLRLALVGDPDRKPDGDFTSHAAQPGDFGRCQLPREAGEERR